MKVVLLVVAVALVGPAAARADPMDGYSGLWSTADKDALVRVEDCGNGSPCGVIQWVKPDADGGLDANNPDSSLRTRLLVGLRILYGFQARGGAWERGRIYDPSSGRTVAGRLARTADGALKVTGCMGPFCQAQVWTRAH